jgi:uncharacterized protein involved in response to NO
MRPAADTGAASLRLLATAPHRLLFFVGASNVLLAMGWWAAWLAFQRWQVPPMPRPALYPGWLHAFVMQYQMLPSFMFGFLLTVFPRWTGLPELPLRRYVPVGIGLLGGQVATLVGALGFGPGLVAGWGLTTLGWLAGLLALGPLLAREAGTTWHARSCFAALLLGLLGLVLMGPFLFGASPIRLFASIKIGTFGLLLPIYLTVSHRMFPFFAANVVDGYVPWRPLWLLTAFWALCLGHLSLELVHGYAWLWLTDLPLLGLTAYLCWRWWPRTAAGQSPPPALLRVLFIGLLWLPVTFALYAGQSIWYVLADHFILGRAPAHALFVGFFGSVLVAMVSRVTQGHSGRALVLPRIALYAFIAVQVVTLTRLAAEVLPDSARWQSLAAIGWLLALGPWALWLACIYLRPRVDGKPG